MPALSGPPAGEGRFQGPDGRRSHRNDVPPPGPSPVDGLGRLRAYLILFSMHSVPVEGRASYRREGSKSDVQRHVTYLRHATDLFQQLRGEVKTRCRGGNRTPGA